MEYQENRVKQPFIGLSVVWQLMKKAWRLQQTRRVLRGMSDEQLKDVGLRRDELG